MNCVCNCEYHVYRPDTRFKNNPADLIVQDKQIDCDCDVEIYDCDINENVIVFESEPRIYKTANGRINLPMSVKAISRQSIIECLVAATELAPSFTLNTMSEFHPATVVSAKNKPYLVKDEWINCVQYDKWPTNLVAYLPSPEVLGCITWNINNHGLFILSGNIRKHIQA